MYAGALRELDNWLILRCAVCGTCLARALITMLSAVGAGQFQQRGDKHERLSGGFGLWPWVCGVLGCEFGESFGESAIAGGVLMKRQDILAAYDVRDGRIVSPGKFEGEPIYTPYFWETGLEGFADSDDEGVMLFAVTEADIAEFPELQGVEGVALEESESGFVYCFPVKGVQ